MLELEWLDEFARNLRSMMRECGYSQRELADAVGVSESTISRYLSATQLPKITILINIAMAFDCTMDELTNFGERIYL